MTRKSQPSNAHGRYWKNCQKWKKMETLIQAVRIYSKDIGMEFGIEKCYMLIMRSKIRQMMKGIVLLNLDNIKMLEEKTYKYLGILKADTMKHAEMIKKQGECTLRERENYMKQNYMVEILSKA